MAHRGSQVAHEDSWRAAERANGRADGLAGRPADSANVHYQRAYRQAAEKRAGLHFTRDSVWGGNGFGNLVTHKAFVGDEQVGEWTNQYPGSAYAYDVRGAQVVFYREWRAIVLREFGARAD